MAHHHAALAAVPTSATTSAAALTLSALPNGQQHPKAVLMAAQQYSGPPAYPAMVTINASAIQAGQPAFPTAPLPPGTVLNGQPAVENSLSGLFKSQSGPLQAPAAPASVFLKQQQLVAAAAAANSSSSKKKKKKSKRGDMERPPSMLASSSLAHSAAASNSSAMAHVVTSAIPASQANLSNNYTQYAATNAAGEKVSH